MHDWIEELVASTQRACNIVHNPIINDTESGHEVFFQLTEVMDPKVSKHFKSYLSHYCRAKGWSAYETTVTKRYVRFLLKPKRPDQRREHPRTA